MQDLACFIAPRKLVIIAGKEDKIFPLYGVKKGYKIVENIFQKVGGKRNLSFNQNTERALVCEDIVWNAIHEETEKLNW